MQTNENKCTLIILSKYVEKYKCLYRRKENVVLTDKGALVEFTDKAALVG